MAKTVKREKTLSVEIIAVQAAIEFAVRENGVIVDRGQLGAPPLFSATQARRWLSEQERDLLAKVRKQREADTNVG